ncbi:hypothetical protein LTR53_012136 [Teratosphaeriaceae sp. CCFEE 6253]|nr:hypothetical protein LTR53_012136 [Teratosphaeriaceae sp. CCFEE 6253]
MALIAPLVGQARRAAAREDAHLLPLFREQYFHTTAMTSSPRRLSARIAATSLATVWRLRSSTVCRAPGAPPYSGPTSFHSAPSPRGSVTGGPSFSAPTSLGSDINTIMASQDPSLPKRDNHTPSCAVCQRRKVKCNRVFPCGPCTKTGLQCEFKPVGEPQGRKRVKRSHDAGEEGDPVAEGGTPPARLSPPQRESDSAGGGASPGVSRGVRGEGGYPYWNAVPTGESPAVSDSTAVRDFRHYRPSTGPAVIDTQDSSASLDPAIAGTEDGKAAKAAGHFLFKKTQTQAVQPPANQIVQLWQTYLSNVDPILKIVHAPTLQQTILGQIGKPVLPSNLQALTSAIYFVSVVSLQDEACETLLQIPRKDLLAQYRQATEDGLSAANFVTTTDITVLQAFVFYLAALRSLGEVAAVWSLAGLALRIAATIGITHDHTSPTATLSPFDRELRRRLWWALVYLDSRTAELVGQDGDRLLQRHDVRLPANLNDTQLFPSMQRLPESRPAATEMSYVLLRALLASHLNTVLGAPGPAGTWARIRSASVPMAEKASVVESLEQRLHEEVLRFCDPTVPLQAHTLNAAQTSLTKMRLVGNIPYDRSPATAGSGEGYSENLFQLSGKMMRLQLELFTDPSLRKWKWHWQGTFQWYALAELLRQTRLRVQAAPETTAAWLLVKRVLEEVVPQLGCDPEKCAILTAVQALFQTAMRHREQGENVTSSNAQSGQESGGQGSTGTPHASGEGRQSPHARQMNGFSLGLGHGSRPFIALLPAMDCMRAPASSVLEAEPGHDQAASSVAGDGVDEVGGMALDFAAVDWVEFDRLAGELSAS